MNLGLQHEHQFSLQKCGNLVLLPQQAYLLLLLRVFIGGVNIVEGVLVKVHSAPLAATIHTSTHPALPIQQMYIYAHLYRKP